METVRKNYYRDSAIKILIGFLIGLSFYFFCEKSFQPGLQAGKQVNPMPPISITNQEDITPENLQILIDWISDNFTVLKYLAYVERGDTLLIIGE